MDAPGTKTAQGDAAASVTVTLAGALTYLFPGAPRRLTVEAATVREMVTALEADWPGMGDRIVDSDAGHPPPHERLRRWRAGGARHAAPPRLASLRAHRDQRGMRPQLRTET